ncbi:exodeoxyribonuclease V alpha subunit [Lachnospiraceae bacterium XBB1006]|nr:exodeoxyribonuclease V alpha subunit [Lachnospiraceae bacterium XBB1006]
MLASVRKMDYNGGESETSGGKNLEELQGYVSNVRYRNEENGYTVFDIVSDEEEYTAVGYIGGLEPGISLLLRGEMGVHPSYGEQFQVSSYEELAPADAVEMERYLGSGAIKGIGVALAARIVKRFKEDTFRIIEEEPERLAEISGISEKKAMDIADQMQRKKDLRQAMMFLQKYGIQMTLGVRIYQKYGLEMYRIINDNPYRIADEIPGVGFKRADEIATKVGIRVDSDYRIRSGIVYTLQQAVAYGHTFLPWEKMLKMATDILGVEEEAIGTQVENLAMERKLILQKREGCEYPDVYLASFFYMEQKAARMLRKLDVTYPGKEAELTRFLELEEKEQGITLDDMQKQAIRSAVQEGLLILTGGPGTGKTTIINAIIRYFEMQNLDIALAAPTGRAAKRMSEVTGIEAKTIHRLLEIGGGLEQQGAFGRDEENPLEYDVVIIDEMSMVDINLFYALLKALVAGTRLILVGDADQLPSVGPGSVLRDMIEANTVPVVRLNKVYRQGEESSIVVNAHCINQGKMVALDNKNRDFFFLKRYDANQVINVTLQLILQKLPGYVDASPYDIQVMTPTRKGLLGVEHLNEVLQHYLNPESPSKEEKKVGNTLFREGDKVMQTKNNYQLPWEVTNRYHVVIDQGMGVFNGDTGIIHKIDHAMERVEVLYEEARVVVYPFAQLDELELAYAVTVHKSQGSEYPAVVIPLLQGPKPLMNRNLLYTAVTRAKRCVTLVGDEHVFTQMVENGQQLTRYSGLKERMREIEKEEC